MNNFVTQQKASAMVIALGIVAILIVISATIATVALVAFRSTTDIARANQAYYAAEAGIEESLFHLAGHQAGFENKKTSALVNNSNNQWNIASRLDQLPALAQGNGDNNNFNALKSGAKLIINLFNDISCNNATNPDCSFDPPVTQNVTNFELKIYQLADGIDLNTLLVGDTRVSEVRVGTEIYQEDSLVAAGNLDLAKTINRTLDLSFVDLNVNGIWDPGEPVYQDLDNNPHVSVGDLRINTISPNFRTCRQTYYPRRKPVDITDLKVSTGQCDSEQALTNIDNDRDGQRDEDPLDGDDNDQDGQVDEDPSFWPLTAGVFYLPSGIPADGSISYEKANLDVYANSPAVSWTVSGKVIESGELREKVFKSYYILRDELSDVPPPASPSADPAVLSLTANSFQERGVNSETIRNILSDATLQDARLSLFTPLKGINYQVSLTDSNSPNKLAREVMVIDSIGSAGDSRQRLQTQVQQIESIPIFNFTITF